MVTNVGATIRAIEERYMNKNLPEFTVGDTIKMMIKVQEGDKTRLHPFEGTVISKTGRGLRGTFTVRKISFGEGVERCFPIHSPVIESLHVVQKGVNKRAKLYYLRERTGKAARVQKEQAQ
ncbi:MAG TPA: 50S ribosomal protein L19 [Candidatus Omnitrophota bacterium]|nr:50S ribosomal protein L19 [Candidatus Omnitrophota bacterium]